MSSHAAKNAILGGITSPRLRLRLELGRRAREEIAHAPSRPVYAAVFLADIDVDAARMRLTNLLELVEWLPADYASPGGRLRRLAGRGRASAAATHVAKEMVDAMTAVAVEAHIRATRCAVERGFFRATYGGDPADARSPLEGPGVARDGGDGERDRTGDRGDGDSDSEGFVGGASDEDVYLFRRRRRIPRARVGSRALRRASIRIPGPSRRFKCSTPRNGVRKRSRAEARGVRGRRVEDRRGAAVRGRLARKTAARRTRGVSVRRAHGTRRGVRGGSLRARGGRRRGARNREASLRRRRRRRRRGRRRRRRRRRRVRRFFEDVPAEAREGKTRARHPRERRVGVTRGKREEANGEVGKGDETGDRTRGATIRAFFAACETSVSTTFVDQGISLKNANPEVRTSTGREILLSFRASVRFDGL